MRELPNIIVLLRTYPKHCVPCLPWKHCRASPQSKALLQAIGVVDSVDASLLYFDPENSELHLPHSIALQISVRCLGKHVHRTVLDEGATTCIMSYSCW